MKQKRAALYVRVSSGEQHTEMQERALREYVQRRGWSQHKIYRDKRTGTSASRPGLDELLKDCRRRAVDVVVVWKFDRFARSLKNLIAGLDLCRALGIDFVSVTEAVDTSLPAGEMLFQMIGAVAQFERSLIAERVRSGLANARANGKVLGRPPLRKLTRKEVADLRKQRVHEKLPFRALAVWGFRLDRTQTMRRKSQLVWLKRPSRTNLMLRGARRFSNSLRRYHAARFQSLLGHPVRRLSRASISSEQYGS